jgi:phosphate transport system permease protein
MAGGEFTVADLAGSARRNRVEKLAGVLFGSAASISLVISAAILGVLLVKGLGFLFGIEWSQLFSSAGWYPRSNRFDLITLFLGSLWVTAIALIVATPLGVGSAVFMSEYSSARSRRFLKPIVEILAGLPSVVIAFLVLQLLYPALLEPFVGRYSLLAAGIGVGILTVPIIAAVTEDALAAVPKSLREASIGMGAKKVTTTTRVVLPAALSGITASLIVGASRALGETMLVMLVAGGANGASRPMVPTESGLTMTAAMASLAVGSDNVATGGAGTVNPVDSLYLVGLVLFVFTLGLNLLGDRVVRRFRQVY